MVVINRRFSIKFLTAQTEIRLILFAILIMVLPSQGYACDQPNNLATSDPLMPLEEKALSGDRLAAIQISNHFLFADILPDKQAYWMRIFAENGTAQDEVGYAKFLSTFANSSSGSHRGDQTDNNIRAFFWMSLAAQRSNDLNLTELTNWLVFNTNLYNPNYWEKIQDDKKEDKWMRLTAQNLQKGRIVLFRIKNGAGLGTQKETYMGALNKKMFKDINIKPDNLIAFQIAAENGDAHSQLSIAYMLAADNTVQDCIRAKFWAERVLEGSNDPLLISRADDILGH
jgi:hypothetical protein